MAPKYVLTYFNARGFAETARMLFVLSGVEYEDKRLEKEQWPAIKPTTPFGQVPMLEVDGIQIAQTTAIYRFLARKFGLAGANLTEEARADMMVECIKDMVMALFKLRSETDEAKKAEMKKEMEETTLPPQMKCLAAFIGEKDFFLGDKLSWVDLVYYNMMPYFGKMDIDLPYATYPALKEVFNRVEANPKIAAWLKTRPVTEN